MDKAENVENIITWMRTPLQTVREGMRILIAILIEFGKGMWEGIYPGLVILLGVVVSPIVISAFVVMTFNEVFKDRPAGEKGAIAVRIERKIMPEFRDFFEFLKILGLIALVIAFCISVFCIANAYIT